MKTKSTSNSGQPNDTELEDYFILPNRTTRSISFTAFTATISYENRADLFKYAKNSRTKSTHKRTLDSKCKSRNVLLQGFK